MNKLILITLLLTLSSCATNWQEREEQAKQAEVIRLGEEAKSPGKAVYREASAHGCSSGSNAAGNYAKQFHKDIDRYVKDPYYKSGWDDGFARCKGQGDALRDVINESL